MHRKLYTHLMCISTSSTGNIVVEAHFLLDLTLFVADDEIFYSDSSFIFIFPIFQFLIFSENSIQFHSRDSLFLSTGHPFRQVGALLNLNQLCRFPAAHLAPSIPMRGFKPMKNNSLETQNVLPHPHTSCSSLI